MHFGKKKSAAKGGKLNQKEALQLVLDSAERAVFAEDYAAGLATWSAVLAPAFAALKIDAPHFTHLFPELRRLSEDPSTPAMTRDVAHRAYHAAERAREHFEALKKGAHKAKRKAHHAAPKRKGHAGGGKHKEDARLAAAMADRALEVQIDDLDREANAAARAGKAAHAAELRERRLVYQAEHDKRMGKKRREKASADGHAPKAAPKPKTAKRGKKKT